MRLAGAPCSCWRWSRPKPVWVVMANSKKITNAILLHHLHTPVSGGSIVSSSNAAMQRASGRIELASKSRSRNLSIVDHSCTDSRRKTTTTPAKPARVTAICAATPRASPGSMADNSTLRGELRKNYFAVRASPVRASDSVVSSLAKNFRWAARSARAYSVR